MNEKDIQTILDKLEIIQLRLDKVELKHRESLTKFGAHIIYINET